MRRLTHENRARISRLRAILNLRLWWRIWRRPLRVPEPDEIASDT